MAGEVNDIIRDAQLLYGQFPRVQELINAALAFQRTNDMLQADVVMLRDEMSEGDIERAALKTNIESLNDKVVALTAENNNLKEAAAKALDDMDKATAPASEQPEGYTNGE